MRIIKLFSIAFLLFCALLCVSHAQVATKIRSVTSLPATCDAGTNNTSADMVSLVTGNATSQIYFCSAPNQWTAVNNGSAGLPSTLPNCTAAGTVSYEGVQFSTQVVNSQTQVCGTLAGASSQNVVAVCTNNCGTSGNATLVYSGLAQAILDGTGVGGDYVIPSATAGQFTDIGASKPSSTVETFGIVTVPNTGAGTAAQIYVQPLSLYAPGSNSNSGNINNAAQFQVPYYSNTGSSNILSGFSACTVNTSTGLLECTLLGTDGLGTGTITMGNGSRPSTPAGGNSILYTDSSTGNLHCVNSSGSDCSGTFIDVRVGYGGSGGVDCTGSNDSTSILQAMINNAPDHSKFVFPANCVVKVSTTSGSPTAITIDSRYGLEFWMEGRNANGCDTSGTGVGGAAIVDSSSYVAGAKIFYINRSQRLQFHNLTIRSGGAVDQVFDVDQVGSTPPVTTNNIWEGICVDNNTATQNSSFSGFRFSNTSTNNVDNMLVRDTNVVCSQSAPTSGTSNGFAILFGGSPNLKNEVVNRLFTNDCSVDINSAGSDTTMQSDDVSGSWINLQDGSVNSMVEGWRAESSNTVIDITAGLNVPHTYVHNDFASSTTPINCGTGCGSVVLLGNASDSAKDYFSPASNGQVSSLFAAGNRNFNFNPMDFAGGAFNIPIGNQSQFALWINNFIINTMGEYYTPSIATTTPNPRQTSPPVILESIWNGTSPTLEDWILQSNVAGSNSDSTLVIANGAGQGSLAGSPTGSNQGNLSTLNHWLAYGGKFSGINLGQAGTPSILSISAQGTLGSTTYTYCVVAHGGNGTSPCSSTLSVVNANATLGGSNFNAIFINPSAGAVSFDVYRTACGGSGICSTNPTGKIGSVLDVSTVSPISNGGGIRFVDNGLSGDASVAPSSNTTGYVTGAELTTPSSNPPSSTEQGYFKAGAGFCSFDSSGIERCPGSGAAPIFIISSACNGNANCLQLTDDDSTDNCGTPLTNFLSNISSYTGPGVPQLFMYGGSVGSGLAYKFSSCALKFTGSMAIHLYATIDCGQSSGDCWEIGPTGLNAYSNTYALHNSGGSVWVTLDGGGTFVGGASLTTGGIHVEPWQFYFAITGNIQMFNFGPTNATSGNCTAYGIYLDTLNNGLIQGMRWISWDTNAGRCAIGNFDNSGSGGEATIELVGNMLAGYGAPHCASQGFVTGGSHVTAHANTIVGFGVPIRIESDKSEDQGTIIDGNSIDTNNCTAKGTESEIWIGGNGISSPSTVAGIVITNNDIHGAFATSGFIAPAPDSSQASPTSMDVSHNESENGTAKVAADTFNCGSTVITPQNFCTQAFNKNMTPGRGVGWAMPPMSRLNWVKLTAQAANVGSQTLLTTTANTAFTPLVFGCQVIISQAATVSSTLPSCVVTYTSGITGGTITQTVTPTSSANTVGTVEAASVNIYTQSGTAVSVTTSGYVSSGATALQYGIYADISGDE